MGDDAGPTGVLQRRRGGEAGSAMEGALYGETVNPDTLFTDSMLEHAAQEAEQAQQQQQGNKYQGVPYSVRQEGKPDSRNPNYTVYHYRIVDPYGHAIKGFYYVSEIVTVLVKVGDLGEPETRSNLPSLDGHFEDKVGVPNPPKSGHYFQKTEQTFTVARKGTTYYLTTKIHQYISVTNGRVSVNRA